MSMGREESQPDPSTTRHRGQAPLGSEDDANAIDLPPKSRGGGPRPAPTTDDGPQQIEEHIAATSGGPETSKAPLARDPSKASRESGDARGSVAAFASGAIDISADDVRTDHEVYGPELDYDAATGKLRFKGVREKTGSQRKHRHASLVLVLCVVAAVVVGGAWLAWYLGRGTASDIPQHQQYPSTPAQGKDVGSSAGAANNTGTTVTNSKPALSYTLEKPEIIGIYPQDGFGPLRSAGLHAFVDQDPNMKIVDLASATTMQMKQRQITNELLRLTSLLKQDNVIAVVGPPVTECAADFMNAIADTGKHIPIILECSGSPSASGWDAITARVNAYRISSGVDRRGKEIARFIEAAVAEGTSVHLLVEEVSVPTGGVRTYGEYLFEEIARNVRDWDAVTSGGSVDVAYYPSGNIEQKFDEFAPVFGRKGIILVLGLGHDFASITQRFCARPTTAPSARPEYPALAARLGGWMNGYALAPLNGSVNLYWSNVFEITDLDISHGRPPPDPLALKLFERRFGLVSPTVRDQAFSFDAAYCLCRAYHSALQKLGGNPVKDGAFPLLDNNALDIVNEQFRTTLFSGITGDIRFEGSLAQNVGSRLDYTIFEPETGTWSIEDYRTLFRFPN